MSRRLFSYCLSSFLNLSGRVAFGMRFIKEMMKSGIHACRMEKGNGRRNNVKEGSSMTSKAVIRSIGILGLRYSFSLGSEIGDLPLLLKVLRYLLYWNSKGTFR